MPQIVILVPDFQGKAVTGAFGQLLREMYPEARLIFGLNGLSEAGLRYVARSVIEFETVIYTGDRKIVGTLASLYEYAVAKYPDAVLVRLDDGEHNPSHIGTLADKAESSTLVVGDLSFVPGQTIIEGTPDWQAHIEDFPQMYAKATGDKVRVSCAHGFMSAQAGVVKKILPRTLNILSLAGQKAGQPLTWGFDGAMILAAVQEGVEVKISPVPAMKLRDRDPQKVKHQTDQHRLLTSVAMEVAKEDGLTL